MISIKARRQKTDKNTRIFGNYLKGRQMKTRLVVSLAVCTLILHLFAGQAALAVDAHQHHGDGANPVQKLHLNAGKKWASDVALRKSMDEINHAMTKALPSIHGNRFANSDYDALAASINQSVAYAVANCKLEAEADAMLHIIIGELLAGAEAMEGKTASSRHDGAARVVQALKSYGKYFQHANWKAAKG